MTHICGRCCCRCIIFIFVSSTRVRSYVRIYKLSGMTSKFSHFFLTLPSVSKRACWDFIEPIGAPWALEYSCVFVFVDAHIYAWGYMLDFLSLWSGTAWQGVGWKLASRVYSLIKQIGNETAPRIYFIQFALMLCDGCSKSCCWCWHRRLIFMGETTSLADRPALHLQIFRWLNIASRNFIISSLDCW